MSEQDVIVKLDAGEYSAVQQTGYVIEKDGSYLVDGFGKVFGVIEHAVFETGEKKARRLAEQCGGRVRTAKRLIVDFYEVDN